MTPTARALIFNEAQPAGFDEGFVNELGFAHINFLSLVRVVGLETFWAFRGLV